jgi:transposase-like protein
VLSRTRFWRRPTNGRTGPWCAQRQALYPLIFFDAIRIKVRDEGTVRNKALYVALGVRADGSKEILGLWIEQSEGAKFWHEQTQASRTF